MDLLPGKTAANRFAGLISAKYQVHGYSVDVTVRSVNSVDPVGQLDFAGSEYTPAGRIAITTRRRRPEDRYEWWDLGRGCYFVEFNETLELADDEIALLEPDERLLRAGASHAPVFLRGRVASVEALLQVDTLRLQIKQNARISRVRIFRFAPSAGGVSAVAKRAAVVAIRAEARPKKPRKKRSAPR